MAGLNPLYPAPDKWRPGDNLLDNWYFVGGGSQLGWGHFPINQWGQTEYTSLNDQYTIDRWLYRSPDGDNLVVHDDYIEVHGVFTQKTEMAIVPGVYTFSVLYENGTLDTITGTVPEARYFNGYMNGANVQFGKSGTDNFILVNYIVKNVSLKAVKFECGDHQTLAHKEGDTWVLNEVPDFREELAKCRAYYRKGYKTFAVATSASFAFTEMEYNMRAVPLALLSILDKDNNPINAVLHEATANGCNTLYSAASEFTAGETYRIEAELNANL